MKTSFATWVFPAVVGVSCAGADPEVVPPPPPPPYVPPPEVPPAAEAPAPEATAKPAPRAEVDPAQAVLGYVKAFNGGQLEEAARAFADDAEWISAGSLVGAASGKANIVNGWKELRDVFAIEVAVRRLFVSQSLWLAQGVLHGKHVGDFEGMKATGKPVGVEHVHIGWIENGRIKKLLSLSNGAGFLSQIGYLKADPPPVAVPSVQAETVKEAADPKNVAAFEAMTTALDKGDLAAWETHVATDATFYDRARGVAIKGAPAIKTALSASSKAFSDKKRETSTFGAGRYVVSHGTMTGTHSGPYGKVAATKKQVTMHLVEVVEFKDAKAFVIERYENPREVLNQLGVEEKYGRGVAKKPGADKPKK